MAVSEQLPTVTTKARFGLVDPVIVSTHNSTSPGVRLAGDPLRTIACGWALKTSAWYEIFLKRIDADLGDRDLDQLTVKDCAEYIRGVTESARSRQTYRLMLGWILACAVQEGWIDSNPAEATRKFANQRKRERLTIEAYQLVHAQSPTCCRTPWTCRC